MNERIGELLVRQNMLTAEQLKRARDEARTNGARLGHQITKLGYLQETELTEFVAKQYGLPSIELGEFEIDPEVIKLIPEEVAIKHTVIPVNRAGSTLILAKQSSAISTTPPLGQFVLTISWSSVTARHRTLAGRRSTSAASEVTRHSRSPWLDCR